MPTLGGFTTARYNEHDTLISKLVRNFNSKKAIFISATSAQAKGISDLSESLKILDYSRDWRKRQ